MSEQTQESQFADTPEGWASRWQMELKAAREALRDFAATGKDADEALRDEKQDNGGKRLCLYASSNQMIGAMLFGRMPQASVGRRFADADDDVARVAAEMLERVLNSDIERADDTFAEATKNAMTDWIGPGLGVQRHRYEVGPMEKAEGKPAILGPDGIERAPAVPETERKTWERVNTDYVHWQDFLYGQCKTWSDVPWVAYRAQMSREALVKRFGAVGNEVPLNAKHATEDGKDDRAHPWDRADVWEIEHKETRKVFWVVEGFGKCLDIKEDPLGLDGFYSCQRPLMANLTTSKLVPVSDYKFAQDLYRSVDVLTTRIDLLAKAVRAAGVYDKSMGPVVEKLVAGGDNKLYAVDGWAAFAEKGGAQGAIVWLPIEQIVKTLAVLRDLRREDIDLLYQVTGQADVMRGQQTANGTPGEAQVKAKFGSVRMQAKQDEIARFASDGQRIRAEIIAKHFDPQTILEASNVLATPDREFAQQAVELLKSRYPEYRVEIKPEAINLTDFAALKEERFEVLTAIGAYFQSMAPVAQALPGSLPFVLEMLQVTVAGLRGGAAYEAILDRAISQAKKAQEAAASAPAQQAPPDPKVVAQQMKGQQRMAEIQAEMQAKLALGNNEARVEREKQIAQTEENTREYALKKQIDVATAPQLPQPQAGGPRR